MPRGNRQTILLIEPDASLQRLLTLGLEHQGMQVVSVSSLTALANQPIANPGLLIMDIDNGWRDDAEMLKAVQAHPYLATLPMVVLAWNQQTLSYSSRPLPLLECVTKPFDARLLQRTVENLLETSATIETAEQQARATTPVTSFVSLAGLCPIITAAGLLLTMIGLMLQLIVAGIGLLVVLAALLWWTLGKRPEPQILLDEFAPHYTPSLP